jgi:ribulose-phosphate 3-epimerase
MNSSKLQIIPAILTQDFTEIEKKAYLVENLVPLIQIDICDGTFTPQSTWPYVRGVLPIFADDFEMPSWEKLDFELDLMIEHPENHIENIKNLGCSRAVIHIGSTSLEGLEKAAVLLDAFDIEVGLGVTNDTNFEDLKKTIQAIHDKDVNVYIQVMGIQNPGRQKQPFDERTFTTLEKIKKAYPDITLQVDGGVSDKTIQDLFKAGVTRLVSGSWLYKEGDSVESKLQLAKSLI